MGQQIECFTRIEGAFKTRYLAPCGWNTYPSFSQWGEVFVEPAMTLAAVDRLVHHATILEMNVESYRRRAAQNSGKEKTKTSTGSGS